MKYYLEGDIGSILKEEVLEYVCSKGAENL